MPIPKSLILFAVIVTIVSIVILVLYAWNWFYLRTERKRAIREWNDIKTVEFILKIEDDNKKES